MGARKCTKWNRRDLISQIFPGSMPGPTTSFTPNFSPLLPLFNLSSYITAMKMLKLYCFIDFDLKIFLNRMFASNILWKVFKVVKNSLNIRCRPEHVYDARAVWCMYLGRGVSIQAYLFSVEEYILCLHTVNLSPLPVCLC